MRALFDAYLVDVLSVSRAALAPPGTPNDASLLYGSAPNIYAPTRSGLETLYRAGLIEQNVTKHSPAYGPKNSLFLAHELEVRDVRVWLELTARDNDYALECWRDKEEAVIGLHRDQEPLQQPLSVRPDAWFVLRLSQAVLVGLVEVDRGTERGEKHWREKLKAYAALFTSGCLPAMTGYTNARVLVICPNERRRDQLAHLLARVDNSLAGRFWVADNKVLSERNLAQGQWRRANEIALCPLISHC